MRFDFEKLDFDSDEYKKEEENIEFFDDDDYDNKDDV